MSLFSYARRALLLGGLRPKNVSCVKIHTTSMALGPDPDTTREIVMKVFERDVKTNSVTFMPASKEKKPTLVIVCGWLGASEKHLNKYVDIWHKRDIDVLRVQTRWIDLLTPQYTMGRAASSVAVGLGDVCQYYPNIFFHTLSSGGYFYASVIDVIMRDVTLLHVKPHMRGFIMDSLTDWPRILSNKLAMSDLLGHSLVRLVPAWSMDLNEMLKSQKECPPLLRVTPSNVEFFLKRNQIIRDNPLNLPALLLCSKIDRLCDLATMIRLAEKWNRKGITVMSQVWRDAPHVELLRYYPEEYCDLIDTFVSRTTVVVK